MNTYTAKINAMTSTTDNPILKYYKEKAIDYAAKLSELREISGNRYGIITGTLRAIIGYQRHHAHNIGDETHETLKEACAWLEWSDAIPKLAWLEYADAREFPSYFRRLWKEYKATGTTQTFMTWWESKEYKASGTTETFMTWWENK